MKTIKIILFPVLFFLVIACNDKKETASKDNITTTASSVPVDAIIITPTATGQVDTIKKSLKAIVEGKIGKAGVKINYHSPAVRNRVIWGGLVPFDQVWVTGAHKATTFETDTDLVIGGKKISAGKYAIFSIPGKDEWTIIINKKWDQHLADDYNVNDDVLRLQVKPETVPGVQERLMYLLSSTTDQTGGIEFYWEKIRLVIPVQVL